MAKKSLAEKLAENSKSVVNTIKTNTIGGFSTTENIKKKRQQKRVVDLDFLNATFDFQHNFKKVSISDVLFHAQYKYKNINFKIYGIYLKVSINILFIKKNGIFKMF